MSGTSPAKDQLVHNNLAHKFLLRLKGCLEFNTAGDITFLGEPPLIEVGPLGFTVTPDGAAFILKHFPREILSHREVKIMRDMTRPVPAAKAPPATSGPSPVPAWVLEDRTTALASMF